MSKTLQVGKYDMPVKSLLVSVTLGILLGTGGVIGKQMTTPPPPRPKPLEAENLPDKDKPKPPPRPEESVPDLLRERESFRTELKKEFVLPPSVRTNQTRTPPVSTMKPFVYFEEDDPKLELSFWASAHVWDGVRYKRKMPTIIYLHPGYDFVSGDDYNKETGLKRFRPSTANEQANYGFVLPIMRGENQQAGAFTLFYEEAYDVVRVVETLTSQPEKFPGVDPKNIYLLGVREGETLALLAAQMTNKVAKVAAIHPVDVAAIVRDRPELVPFVTDDEDRLNKEIRLRSPRYFAGSFKAQSVRVYYPDVPKTPEAVKALAEQIQASAVAQALDVKAVDVKAKDEAEFSRSVIGRVLTYFKEPLKKK